MRRGEIAGRGRQSTDLGWLHAYASATGFDARFWARTDKTEGCWIWTGGRGRATRPGFVYGQVKIRPQRFATHRISWALVNGAIPRGMCICHRCDVPLCVNPDHLFVGTQADNLRDAWEKGRARGHTFTIEERERAHANRAIGSRLGSARLTEARVIELRELRASGVSIADLVQRFGLNRGTIWKAATRRSWRHVP